MPTYEYACKACGEHLEVVQSFKDDELTECPNCDGGQLRKVFSAAGIIFKGSGWHIKDYGNKKTDSSTTKVAAAGDSDSASSSTDSAKKSDAKAESKDATKSPSKTEASGSSSKGTSKSTKASTSSD